MADGMEGFNKGASVRFVGGKYKGKTGFINADKKATGFRCYVLIPGRIVNGKPKPDTYVEPKNVEERRGPALNYEEAALEQHPPVEEMMRKLTQQLVMLHIGFNGNTKAITTIFESMLSKSWSDQLALGTRDLGQ